MDKQVIIMIVKADGFTMGLDMLKDYLIGSREGDLNLASVGDGEVAREINLGTPKDATLGLGEIICRFNIRAGAPQGQTIINSFESITFPLPTSFLGIDGTYPGIGRDGYGNLLLRGGDGSIVLDVPLGQLIYAFNVPAADPHSLGAIYQDENHNLKVSQG